MPLITATLPSSGRQLFEQDATLAISDITMLGEGDTDDAAIDNVAPSEEVSSAWYECAAWMYEVHSAPFSAHHFQRSTESLKACTVTRSFSPLLGMLFFVMGDELGWARGRKEHYMATYTTHFLPSTRRNRLSGRGSLRTTTTMQVPRRGRRLLPCLRLRHRQRPHLHLQRQLPQLLPQV